jgi:hypothetical protein
MTVFLIIVAVVLAGLRVPPVLAVPVLIVAAALWLYFHPNKPCRCTRRKIPGTNWGSTKRRSGTCRRCGGSRQVLAPGSRQVHRAVRAVVGYRRNHKEN